ncbi:MAG: hypothetical protein V2I35_12485 [Desulfocapsaceae bacterium]|jgi:hypothetical protein|nr:hypothetical protein [Desulfocapsaceae bacterium]
MLKSTKSIIFTSFIVFVFALLIVIMMGVRQVQLNREYSDISALSESTLFIFATVREQVTEALISGDEQLLGAVIPEIEKLHNIIGRFFESDVIPGQYKLALTERIDLAGLVIDIRKSGSGAGDPEAGLTLQQDMRVIGDNLLKIDRVIISQIRNGVVAFQLSLIGVMGLLISCFCFILILLYRRTINPLLLLAGQLEDSPVDSGSLSCADGAATEIVGIMDSVKQIAMRGGSGDNDFSQSKDRKILAGTINETTNGLNGMINYAQLLLESEAPLLPEQRQMLKEIIGSGEHIAEQWQKLSRQFST